MVDVVHTANFGQMPPRLDRPAPAHNPAMVDQPAERRTFGRSILAIVNGDITRVAADAILNAANSAFAHGGGVDGALRAAELDAYCQGAARRR